MQLTAGHATVRDLPVSAALMYGEPTEYRESLGFNDQYGIETYWKVRVRDWFSVTADIQVVNNIDKDLEVVPGLRVKINK